MNRFMSDIEPASLALAAVILVVAALLGYGEWVDRRRRPAELTADDHAHFARRDRRRSTGLSILSLLALGVVVGSRTSPRVGVQPNPSFLAIWLLIFALIMGLLSLALVDWFDLRSYARRKKNAIGREHLARLRREIDRFQDSSTPGSDGGAL